ncbi:MAG TPA: hypothetical protein VKA84_08505 [Gemmatimonadaceae bacterium]|nr:hypothetical protein [Gemmatimonadaceae bacterium]
MMFLLGALIVGGALGFAADRVAVRDRLSAPADRRALRDRMAEELGLSVAQRAALDTILDERHERLTALIQPIKPQLDAVKDTARQRIRRMLTAEQQAVFDEMQRQMQSAPK